MIRSLRLAGALSLLASASLAAQAAGIRHMETLLDSLVGEWQMVGTVRGNPATYALAVTRVLQGSFIELHMVDVGRPPDYEARVFIGVDSANGQYIVHWLDKFGAAYSIPPATGIARGDTVLFTFRYPSGPFRDSFVHDRRRGSWYFRLEDTDSTGHWRLFAEYQVRRN